MQELELTWKNLIAVYWVMLWRGVVIGIAVAIPVGFAVGVIVGLVMFYGLAIPYDATTYQRVGRTVGFLVGMAWGIVLGPILLRMALRKKYKEFRIALVPVNPPESAH